VNGESYEHLSVNRSLQRLSEIEEKTVMAGEWNGCERNGFEDDAF